MARPAFLRNITHRVLWTVTLVGTVALCVYWVALREPQADWRVLAMGLLLAVALGWWPIIAAATGTVLAVAAWFFASSEGLERVQTAQEVLFFTALGLGWGVLLRGLITPSKSEAVSLRSAEPARTFDPFSGTPARPASIPTRPAPEPAIRPAPPHAPAPVAAPVVAAPPAPNAPPAAEPAVPQRPAAPHETTFDGFVMPKLGGSDAPPPPDRPAAAPQQRPAPPPLPSASPSLLAPTPAPNAPPGPAPAAVPLAAPLFTQEVDLADFKAFVASQQAAASPEAPVDSLPVNRISGRSVEARTPLAPPPPPGLDSSSVASDPSSVAPDPNLRRSAALARPETVPGAPYEAVLEWYNQFCWAPWSAEELEKRYYRHGQKVGWDVLALQDLVRAWKVWQQGPKPVASGDGSTNLGELEGFLRCEMLGLLRHQGHPDLHLLTREERSDAWMAVYRETRGRLRGGSPVLRPMPDDLVAFDPERLLSGRPDALVDVGGESDVVAFVTPLSPGESMTWSGVYASAQHKLAERLGVVVTSHPIVMRQPMPIWDERRQPRLHEVEDKATELRKLDAALERFQRIREGAAAPRPQTHASVCNGCGARHSCPAYAGARPRLDLGDPPPILRKFLQ